MPPLNGIYFGCRLKLPFYGPLGGESWPVYPRETSAKLVMTAAPQKAAVPVVGRGGRVGPKAALRTGMTRQTLQTQRIKHLAKRISVLTKSEGRD
jgi:hypothetical protein